MARVADIASWMEDFAPIGAAESWDNVGLLLGDPASEVSKIMTCLTVTWQTVDEAVDEGATLVVSHHPCPFKPLNRITTLAVPGEHLWRLARSGTSLYSPHTAFDSAVDGINQQWLERLGLENIQPLVPATAVKLESLPAALGSGRMAEFLEPIELYDFVAMIRGTVEGSHLRGVDQERQVQKVAVACGSGASFLSAAHRHGCDTLITGEATFHQCLEAEHLGMNLVLVGHYASERFAVEALAGKLQEAFPAIATWASRREADPLVHWS